uniref:ATP synthase complex subunit 8 n=1 Tax=Staphylinoidea sp. 4 KM-2017 TaxID=2219458 RepID=A0A346RFE1_9COLE|nr:ATP synthase F0 subunit 8 [Staphylinoidea sp. 4 KM-2017]
MPQMAPMNWLFLFIYTIIIFMMFNIINYYSFIYKSKYSTKKNEIYKINWKW